MKQLLAGVVIGAVIAAAVTFGVMSSRRGTTAGGGTGGGNVLKTGGPPDFNCSKPGHYPAVKRQPAADGHCDTNWDVGSEVANDPDHTTIGLKVSSHEQVHFKHSKGAKFLYVVRPNPNNDENPPLNTTVQPGCESNPFDDATAGTLDTHHDAKLKSTMSSATVCYYKITFFSDNGATIDPHIAVGK